MLCAAIGMLSSESHLNLVRISSESRRSAPRADSTRLDSTCEHSSEHVHVHACVAVCPEMLCTPQPLFHVVHAVWSHALGSVRAMPSSMPSGRSELRLMLAAALQMRARIRIQHLSNPPREPQSCVLSSVVGRPSNPANAYVHRIVLPRNV